MMDNSQIFMSRHRTQANFGSGNITRRSSSSSGFPDTWERVEELRREMQVGKIQKKPACLFVCLFVCQNIVPALGEVCPSYSGGTRKIVATS